MSVLNLNQAAHGDTFEVLLGFLEDEIRARDGPALGDSGEGNRTACGQAHVVCGAHGEIGEELQVPDLVCTELEVTDGDPILRYSPQRSEFRGLYVDGLAEGGKGLLGFGV